MEKYVKSKYFFVIMKKEQECKINKREVKSRNAREIRKKSSKIKKLERIPSKIKKY